jgi:predicted secreted Zn-dependent protease
VFASVYVYSSQDAKVTWTKALRKATLKRRHYEDHKKINKYQAKSMKQRIVLPQHTIQLRAPDCPVH